MLLCTVTLRQKHIQENECVASSETQQWLRVSRDAPEQKIPNPTVHGSSATDGQRPRYLIVCLIVCLIVFNCVFNCDVGPNPSRCPRTTFPYRSSLNSHSICVCKIWISVRNN